MIPNFTDGFFSISDKHGFLPMQDPLQRLPDKYSSLQLILDKLSIFAMDCSNDGLEVAVKTALPNYTEEVQSESDMPLIVALYRGYCFLASAYLLYPAYVGFRRTGDYGEGRDRLPETIAQPLIAIAAKLDVFPFLEYSYGYSLGNYVRKDRAGSLQYENLGMANHFSGTTDETGFIMIHVDINQHTPGMIHGCNQILEKMAESHRAGSPVDVVDDLREVLHVLVEMNQSRRKMWLASRWEHYNDFRVYIMGIKGNTAIFPRGVIYEPETEPRFYRGQSGSQDSIIPFLDNFFRICDHYPDNELTSYLMDMRSYRPKPFRELMSWIGENSKGIVQWLLSNDPTLDTCDLLVSIYKQVYDFRNGHWQFVQKYIMANTSYPVATGGTPIVSWLPNQIAATLDAMKVILDFVEHHKGKERAVQPGRWEEYQSDYLRMMELLSEQRKVLQSPSSSDESTEGKILACPKMEGSKCPHQAHGIFALNKIYQQEDVSSEVKSTM